jgi:hypothetical protein
MFVIEKLKGSGPGGKASNTKAYAYHAAYTAAIVVVCRGAYLFANQGK